MWPLIASGGLSILGSILGRGEHKTIDPEQLRMLFGPGALSGDTQELYRMLLNSPAFAEMMNSMSTQGTNLGNSINARIAGSGAGGSPIAAFARAAGVGYGGAMQRRGQSELFLKALMEASGNLNTRAGIWGNSQLRRQEQPTWGRMVGASMLNAGAQGFSNWLTPTRPAATAPVTGGPSILAPEQPTNWWDIINRPGEGGLA